MVLQIYLQMWMKIIKIWWPALIFIIVGLAVLAYSERRDRLENMGND